MMNPAIFLIILALFALFQVSILPIPLGLLALIFWFIRRGEKYLVIFIATFSLLLAVISNLPAWAVLAATSVGLYTFIGAKHFLPGRLAVHLSLILASFIVWEATLVGLLRLFNA